jgi:hypothetical protein
MVASFSKTTAENTPFFVLIVTEVRQLLHGVFLKRHLEKLDRYFQLKNTCSTRGYNMPRTLDVMAGSMLVHEIPYSREE